MNTNANAITIGWNPSSSPFISGYRVHLGVVSGRYDKVIDAGNTSEYELSDTESEEYSFSAVSAYNIFGFDSPLSEEVVIEHPNPEGLAREILLVFLEAEAGEITGPLQQFDSEEFSWVESTTSSQDGQVSLSFNVPNAGDYQIWCRVRGDTNGSDSFFVTLDDGEEQIFHLHGIATPTEEDLQSGWVWREINFSGLIQSFALEEGAHQLTFRSREFGAKLDRVVVSSDPSFVPDDSLPRVGPFIQISSLLQEATLIESETLLIWARILSTGPVRYQWFRNGQLISNASVPYFNIGFGTSRDAGIYELRVINEEGGETVHSELIPISFQERPLTITSFQHSAPRLRIFTIQGGAGERLELLASSTLEEEDWDLVHTWTNENGRLNFEEPEGASFARRFYRIRESALLSNLLITKLEPLAPDKVRLHIGGRLNERMEVEASSDLSVGSWRSLGIQENQFGAIEVDDPEGLNSNRRFYRLRAVN